MARVPLRSLQDPSEEVQSLYDVVRGVRHKVPHAADRQSGSIPEKLPEMWRALAHSPLLGKWVAEGSKVFFTENGWAADNPGPRQLLILTLSRRLGSELVFRWHAGLAESCGISREKVDALREGSACAGASRAFDDDERLLISFADEVATTGNAGAGIFAEVLERYGTKSAVEISTFIAFYLCVISLCNVLGVQDD